MLRNMPLQTDFAYMHDSQSATRPGTAYGVQVIPGNNTYGSYTSLLVSALARQVSFISLHFTQCATSTAARDMICNLAMDPTGGTSYTVILAPNLLASCASLEHASVPCGGVWYHFPLRIPAGATLGVNASVNNATVGQVRARCVVYGLPKYAFRTGSWVRAYGINVGTSSGTAITSGGASEGAWTSLGAISHEAWWWQAGFGINNSTMALLSYHMDLGIGDGTNNVIVGQNELIETTTAETMYKQGVLNGCNHQAVAGTDSVYGRLQCSGTPDTGLTMAAYGMGG